MTREELSHLEKGDLIEYVWYDILIDETGDPSKSRLLKRKQYGLFLELKVDLQSKIEFMSTAGGIDIDEDAVPQSGWQATPVALVQSVKRIRRAPKKRKKNGSTLETSPVREVPGGVDQVRG